MNTISRRALLGSAALVALPAAAFAASPIAFSAPVSAPAAPSVADLRKALGAARAEAEEASEAQQAIWERAGEPEWPHVHAKEFPAYCRPFKWDRFHTLEEINAIMDRRQNELRLNAPAMKCVMFDNAIAEAEETRSRLQSIFLERKAAYDAWSHASGHHAASETVGALWDEYFSLQERLLDFKCEHLADLAAKAAYIVDEFGEEYGRQHEFILEVAAFAQAEAAR